MPEGRDLRFAEIAVGKKLLSMAQVEECRRAEAVATQAGVPVSFAEVAVKKGYLQQSQADAILRELDAAETGRKSPARVGNYELISKLGEGGMGAVYKARQLGMERLVALKILPRRLAKDQSFIDRFYREARSVGRLNHVNIVAAHEVGEADGYHFLAMEFVDGESLAKLLKRETKLPEDRALEITIHIARAIGFAWQEARMVHRDIKPDNILLTTKGIAKLADLGLAKATDEEASTVTQTGVALGTPNYISPEQARGEKRIDIRSDIYSLGATLYHIVTGKTPFSGSSAGVVMAKHLTEQLPDPKDVNPLLSDGICHVIEKMMAKDPNDRYADGVELLRDLELVIDGKDPESMEVDTAKSSVARCAVREERVAIKRGRAPNLSPRGSSAGDEPKGERAVPHRRHAKHAAKAKSNTPLIVGVGAGVLAVAVVILFMLSGSGGSPAAPAQPQAARPADPGAKPTPAAVDLNRAKAAFDGVESYSLQNKEDYDRIIASFEGVARRYPGTVYAKTAAGRAEEYRKKKAEALAEKDRQKVDEESKAQEEVKRAEQKKKEEGKRLAREAEEKKAADRVEKVRAEVVVAVPELKGAGSQTKLRTLTEARAKLEALKTLGIQSVSDAVAGDIEKLKELERQAAAPEIAAAVARSHKTTDEAQEFIRRTDFGTARKTVDSALVALRQAAEGLDKQIGAPLQAEISRGEGLLADIQLLVKTREVGLLHAHELIGRSITVGTVSGKVEKVENGKLTLRSGDIAFARPTEDVLMSDLGPVALKHLDDRKKCLDVTFLLAYYYGNLGQARKTLSEARQSGMDVTRFEAMVKEVETGEGKARFEEAARRLLEQARSEARKGKMEKLAAILVELRAKYAATDVVRSASDEIEQLRFKVDSQTAIADQWRIYRGNMFRTGRSRYSGPSKPAIKWAFDTQTPIWLSSPAIGSDGTIYISNQRGILFAVAPDGSQKWAFKTGDKIESSPAVGPDGTVYVNSCDGNLYAIEPDGKRKWDVRVGSSNSTPMIGPDGTLYVGGGDFSLHAIRREGMQKWVFQTKSRTQSSPAMGADGTVYVGGGFGDNNLYALRRDGTRKWAIALSANESSVALGDDGTVYAGCGDGLYAIAPDGKRKWVFRLANEWSSPAIGTDGAIYIGSSDFNLYAVTPSGERKWAFKTGDVVASSPVVGADGTIYVGSKDSRLYAIGPAGIPKWTHKMGGSVSSSPAVGTDGTLYVGCEDGKLYAICDEQSRPAAPPK